MMVITAPHFCAAVIFKDRYVVRTAPILKYMLGWNREQVLGYCQTKKWHCEEE